MRQVWGVRGSGARQGWAALVGIRAGKGRSEHAQGDREPTGNSRAGKLVPPQGEGGVHKGRGSGCWGGVLYRRVNQTGENTKAEGSGFSLLEKRVTNVEKEKSRMNSVISDWDWKNCCEHTISNTQRHRNGHRYVRVPVCTHPCLHQSVRLELQEQPRPQRE